MYRLRINKNTKEIDYESLSTIMAYNYRNNNVHIIWWNNKVSE